MISLTARATRRRIDTLSCNRLLARHDTLRYRSANMPALIISNPFARLGLRAALDILIIALLIYYMLKLLRGTRAMQMLVAILLLIVLYEGARRAQFEMVEWLLDTLLPYVAIALIVLFQPEIRRALDRFGRNLSLARFSSSNPTSSFDDVVLAAGYFAQNRIGALIAFERDVGLRTYIESGIPLDANLSYDLLLAIFRPGSPLHDGAVIVQGSRIASAACFLPLTLNPLTSTQLAPDIARPSASRRRAIPWRWSYPSRPERSPWPSAARSSWG